MTRGRKNRVHHHYVVASGFVSVGCGRTVVSILTVLAEGEGLRSAQLGSVLLELAHFALTGITVLLVFHFDVVLGEATLAIFGEESAVAALQYIYFGVGELGVTLGVGSAVRFTNMACHQGSSVSRILAVEYQKSLAWKHLLKQLSSDGLLVVVVYGTINVATIKLIFKAAVNDQALIKA